MEKIINKINWPLYLAGIIIFELLSFLGFFWPIIHYFLIPLIFLATLIIAYRHLEWGLLIILTELIIGSHGHLLSIDIFNFSFSLRMALWSAVLLAFFVNFNKFYPKISAVYKKIPLLKIYILLAIFVGWGLLAAYLFNNDLNLIFTDFNAWLFFLLLLPMATVYVEAKQSVFKRLESVFFLAVFFLSLKTLILLFIFSHDLFFIPDLYRWLRVAGIAEVTVFPGAWPRIFLQSHIYSAIAFLLLVFRKDMAETWNFSRLFLGAIFLSTVIISFSRSFWLALSVVFIIFTIFILLKIKNYLQIKNWLLQNLIIVILAFSIIFLVNNIPLLTSSSDFSLRIIRDRASYQQTEAALASRWSLLPVLSQAIRQSPILGQGFGATLEYQSSDPRVLEKNEDGWYRTHAFEWGYLDIWFKLGLGGLLVYLYLLLSLFIRSYQQRDLYFFTPALLFLIIVHFFTPYLNHPLGIMIILLSSCLLVEDKV